MKTQKTIIGVLLLLLIFSCANKNQSQWERKVDTEILPDSIRAEQIKDMKFGMFICWSFSTFSGREWTPTLDKDASYFKATGGDTDHWCKTAKDAGMGYILFPARYKMNS